MKVKTLFVSMLLCFTSVLSAQKSLDWYSYWGSNEAGSQIDPVKMLVDNSGNIYIAALFGGDKVSILEQTVESNSAVDKGDAIIVKMTADKNLVWKYQLVANGNASVSDIAFDPSGNLVVTGSFKGAIQVGENTMALNDAYMGEEGIYVLRLDADGNALNAWQIAAIGATSNSVSTDATGNVIVSGILDGDAWFSGTAAEGDFQNIAQMFVAKYASDGTLLWKNFKQDANAASSFSHAYSTVDADGNIYVAGTLTGTTTFAGITITATSSNMFLVKYADDGNEQWVHHIKGSRSDNASGVAVSPIGEVAIAGNYYSEDLTIDQSLDTLHNGFANLEGTATQYHTGIFSFNTTDGSYRWWYSFGMGSTVGGGGALACYIRCTDEGVWLVGGTMSGRFGDLYTYENFGNSKSGLKTVDGQWLQHNTNGGNDSYFMALSREGKLCSLVRPGGIQSEFAVDAALSPDKKNIYYLTRIQVRANVCYTCVDNLFDSYTDIKNAKFNRKNLYTLLPVYCPENTGAEVTYTSAYTGIFASSLLAKYTMPEINPNELPYFTVNEDYTQTVELVDATENDEIYPLGMSDDLSFSNNTLSGKPTTNDDRYFGFVAIDDIPLPIGGITYYAQDPDSLSIRGNPRNVRYMSLTTNQGSGFSSVSANDLDVRFYPTVCTDMLHISTNEVYYTVNIYTQQGQMIFSKENVVAIQVGNLPAGLYYVQLRNIAGKQVAQKFFVK